MSELHLLRPWWILAVAPWLWLMWRAWRSARGETDWLRICDERLLPYLLEGTPNRARRWALLALTFGGLIAILAAAGPAWERLEQPVFRSASALVVVLDLSSSMDSTDLPPSRLERARLKLLDLLERRREGLTGLIVYAAEPFVVTPLTDDTATIAALVPSLSTAIMPGQGSRLDLALERAQNLLEQAGVTEGDILLIGDSPGAEPAETAIGDLTAAGYRLLVLGVGTSTGAPVPVPGGGFLKDAAGAIVVPGVDFEGLRRLAESGNGRFATLATDDGDLDSLLSGAPGAPGEDAQATAAKTDLWREEGPWLLLAVLPLAAFGFRRGYLVVLAALLAPFPSPSHAFDWEGLWERADQRAAELFSAGEPAAASGLFEDPRWRAAAQYRAGEFSASAKTLTAFEDPEAQYNRGNALARSGQLEEALAAYDKALALDNAHEDARYNRDLVAEQLRRRKDQPHGQGVEGGNDNRSDPRDSSGEQQGGGDEPQPREPQGGSSSGPDKRQPESGSQSQQPASSEKDSSSSPADQSKSQDPQDDAVQDPSFNPDESQPESTKSAENAQTRTRTPEDTRGNGDRRDISENAETEDGPPPSEESLALQQWLRRIPDDPGGLLRRKFMYQYQQREHPRREPQPW